MQMRRCMIGAGLLVSLGSAGAQEVDCEALRRTNIPHQITYDVAETTSAGARRAFVAVEQFHRWEDGSGRRLRRNAGQMQVMRMEMRHSFATRVGLGSGEAELAIEGVSLDVDHFAAGRDFRYTRRARFPGGREENDENRAYLRGEETMTVSGCAFRVLVWDVERHNPTPPPGRPADSVETFWYAPELRAFLRARLIFAGQPVAREQTATRIETQFAPFE